MPPPNRRVWFDYSCCKECEKSNECYECDLIKERQWSKKCSGCMITNYHTGEFLIYDSSVDNYSQYIR